jgi:hypothetical protein
MKNALIQLVRQRSHGCCEYCLLPELYDLPFQIDHIIAEQHGGKTIELNLAYSCTPCNKFKGPNIASLDPDRLPHQAILLFNPRTNLWKEHFKLEDELIVGTSSTGRVTVFLLQFNGPKQRRLRKMLMREGLYPPPHHQP